MKKIVLSMAVIATSMVLQAADTSIISEGTVSGQLKVMHIISDYDNSFTPSDGSGYLGELKYVTPEVLKGLKFGAAFYVNGDTGLTDWEDNSKNAQGMFTAVEGAEKSQFGQAYLEYKSDMINVKAGRQILDTPLTKIQWSLMPNFYEAYMLDTNILPDFSFNLGQITRMSYGSRTATDFSLIGEKTGTAGVVQAVVGQGSGDLVQAEFHSLAEGANIDENTNGMTVAGATYTGVKGLTTSLWNYYAWDIVNDLYAEVEYKYPVMKGTNLTVSAQYLAQTEVGDAHAGDKDFNMMGAKAKIGNKKWSACIAYNKSNDGDSAFFNAWGADPAYTSSIFSRNAYRQDVSAYKIGAHYTIMKGLKIIASYANYGQSKTKGWGSLYASNDAYEADIALVYKPTKAWTLKVFNAIRVSEYNDDSTIGELKQNHIRAVGVYKF
jgi:hypothetical protein